MANSTVRMSSAPCRSSTGAGAAAGGGAATTRAAGARKKKSAEGIYCRPVNVDYASHSPRMARLVPALRADLAA
ncbi:hypothetical protein, partial [Nocardia farcinica]|uniref:hypothetical protein n=1 Tax=Nocardia farcinica TaxID=37329 RepID=UPI0024573768